MQTPPSQLPPARKPGKLNRLFMWIGGGLLVCCLGAGVITMLNPRDDTAATATLQPAPTSALVPANTAEPASPTVAPTTAPAAATSKPTLTSLPTLRSIATTQASTQAQPTATLAPAFTATAGIVDTPVPADTQPPAATQEPTQAPITLVSLTSPINKGADARLIVQVSAGANCFLTYYAPSGRESGADGLGNTAADGNGQCSWTWNIGPSTGEGTGTLVVSSAGQTVRFDIVIQ